MISLRIRVCKIRMLASTNPLDSEWLAFPSTFRIPIRCKNDNTSLFENIDALSTINNLVIKPELQKLYEYLKDRGGISALDNYDCNCLTIFSRDVLNRIKHGDSSWESMVPASVAEVIKNKSYFEYQSQ